MTPDPDRLIEVIEHLPDRIKQALNLYFGIWGDRHTYKEAGKKMGVGAERVRQLVGKGLRMLRHPSLLLYMVGLRDTYIKPKYKKRSE